MFVTCSMNPASSFLIFVRIRLKQQEFSFTISNIVSSCALMQSLQRQAQLWADEFLITATLVDKTHQND